MQEAVSIFLAGLGGVFVGMTLLYLSIRITSFITGRLEAGKNKDE